MGRKTQITKEVILQAAYEILENEGYSMVNIKSVAAKIGCSTQPISWQFGNMLKMREELYKYASERIFGCIDEKMAGKNAVNAFFETGKIYLSNACDYPNVFRFLCVDDPGKIVEKSDDITKLLGDEFIKEMLAKEIDLSKDIIDKIVADIVIYTHGLAVLLTWDSFTLDKQTTYDMIYEQAILCFSKYGVDIKKHLT